MQINFDKTAATHEVVKEDLCVVVLMAGRGSRMLKAGSIAQPKWALCPQNQRRTLLDLSLAGVLAATPASHVVFVGLQADFAHYSPQDALSTVSPVSAQVIALPEVTRGPLHTLSIAWPFTQKFRWVLVQVCDTYVPNLSSNALRLLALNGTVFCFDYDQPNFCHVDVSESGTVVGLREKVGHLSQFGSSGLFLLPRTEIVSDSIASTLNTAPVRSNGEHYISDLINRLLSRGVIFRQVIIPGARSIGTAEELESFR